MKLKQILPWIGELDLTKILQWLAVAAMFAFALWTYNTKFDNMVRSLGGIPMPDISDHH